MSARPVRAACLAVPAVLALLLSPAALRAQRVLGPGDDAVTLPRGGVRVALGGESTLQRDRWRDGRLEGLGGSLAGDAFGALQFSMLAPVEQTVRALGVADFTGSLGASRLDARQRWFVTPLAVEYGLTDWLTLGARAALVRSRAESQWRVRGDSGRATLGVNPYFTGTAVGAANAATIGAYGAAAANLAARRAACQANPAAAPECPTILAELPAVDALTARVGDFATNLRALYGAGTARGQRYVPMAGSAAEQALLARVDSLRTALVRYGISDVGASTGLPAGAQVPVSAADLDRLLADSTDGYGARPLDDGAILQLGDVHVGAKLRLFDSFARLPDDRFTRGRRGLRQSVLVDVRLGTGTPERPDAFLDLGTGTGTSAVTVRSLTDLVANERLWVTVSAGYTVGARHERQLRVPSAAGTEWLEQWREATVAVEPGAQVDVAIAPRWHVGDYLALGALWSWRGRAADRHTYTAAVTTPLGAPTVLDARFLDDGTEASEQRFGWSATYSTLAANARGVRALPIEISYAHEQSAGSGSGVVPKQFTDRLQVRYYTRFLGR